MLRRAAWLRVLIVMLALLGASASLTHAFPPVTGPVSLDHGFRYEHIVDVRGCSVGISDDLIAFVTARRNDGRLDGKRYTTDGQSIDANMFPLNGELDHAPIHAISEEDSLGWKLVAVRQEEEQSHLRVYGFDPATMDPIQSPLHMVTAPSISNVRVAFSGSIHAILWTEATTEEDYQVRFARVTPDLTLANPGIVEIGAGESWGTIDVAARADAAMVSWLDSSGQLWCQGLDALGQPVGNPVLLESDMQHMTYNFVTLCSLGENWLVAWSGPEWEDPVRYTFVDDSGNPVQPYPTEVPGVVAEGGLACSSAGDIALIASLRDDTGDLLGVRVLSDGTLLDDTPITIAPPSYVATSPKTSVNPTHVCLVRTG